MKTLLTILFTAAFAAAASAHQAVDLGPNGGRLLDFGKGQPLKAEVVLKDGKFHVGLYDSAAKKIVAPGSRVLTITTADRSKPKSLDLKLEDGRWTTSKPPGDNFWLIFQLRESASTPAKTSRLHYDASNCGGCNRPEWLCRCGADDRK
jgi:hypothetical protein